MILPGVLKFFLFLLTTSQPNTLHLSLSFSLSLFLCVCLCVYTLLPSRRLLSPRWLTETWGVRINDVMLWVSFQVFLPSSLISISENAIFTSKDETTARWQLEGKRYIWFHEKMISIDIGYKSVTQQTDNWGKNTKDKEATLI